MRRENLDEAQKKSKFLFNLLLTHNKNFRSKIYSFLDFGYAAKPEISASAACSKNKKKIMRVYNTGMLFLPEI
jgi:hypothetical protein